MAKTCYQWCDFNQTALDIIAHSERLLNSYARQGYRITHSELLAKARWETRER